MKKFLGVVLGLCIAMTTAFGANFPQNFQNYLKIIQIQALKNLKPILQKNILIGKTNIFLDNMLQFTNTKKNFHC